MPSEVQNGSPYLETLFLEAVGDTWAILEGAVTHGKCFLVIQVEKVLIISPFGYSVCLPVNFLG